MRFASVLFVGVGEDGCFARRIYGDFISFALGEKLKYLGTPASMELICHCLHRISGGRFGLNRFSCSLTEPVVSRRKPRSLLEIADSSSC